MSREVRRVPEHWQHPRVDGQYIPLFGGSYAKRAQAYQEGYDKWQEGLRSDWRGGWQPKDEAELAMSYEQWDGGPPKIEDYMPDWPDEQRTHYQMYETTSEGTPISPVMENPEALARWLSDHHASAFADTTATYEQWIGMIHRSQE
jgi:hypothetical protein